MTLPLLSHHVTQPVLSQCYNIRTQPFTSCDHLLILSLLIMLRRHWTHQLMAKTTTTYSYWRKHPMWSNLCSVNNLMHLGQTWVIYVPLEMIFLTYSIIPSAIEQCLEYFRIYPKCISRQAVILFFILCFSSTTFWTCKKQEQLNTLQ